MKHSIRRHLDYLCRDVGGRLIGTEGNERAAAYIESVFRDARLAPRRQPFDCPRWTPGDAYLRVADRELPCLANTFSPPCDVRGRATVLDSLEALEEAELRGEVCILTGDLSEEPLGNLSSPAYLPERHRRIATLLLAKGPIAIVALSHEPGYTLPILEDWLLTIPSVTLAADHALTLVSLVDRPGREVALRIEAERGEGTSWNVVAGTSDLSEPRLVLCAHYDTKPYTVGAFDNASGTAVLLALAERLAAAAWPAGLEFVAFSGEEYGLGGHSYLEPFGLEVLPFAQEYHHEPSDLDQVIAALNFDGVGAVLGRDGVAVMASSPSLDRLVSETLASHPGLRLAEPWPASNHYDFYTHGVPSLAFTSSGVPNLIHHERDVARWLDDDKLTRVAEFAVHLVERLAERSPAWTRADAG